MEEGCGTLDGLLGILGWGRLQGRKEEGGQGHCRAVWWRQLCSTQCRKRRCCPAGKGRAILGWVGASQLAGLVCPVMTPPSRCWRRQKVAVGRLRMRHDTRASSSSLQGPDVGGDNGPYRQSERAQIYKEYVDQLVGVTNGVTRGSHRCRQRVRERLATRLRCTSPSRRPQSAGQRRRTESWRPSNE